MANGPSVNINVNTDQAERDLADLTKSVNDFLSAQGKASGKKVRLMDLSADIDEIKQIQKAMTAVINSHQSIRSAMNMAGQGAGNRPNIPSQMTAMPGESAKDLTNRITFAVSRMMQHYYNSSPNAAPNGLTPKDMVPGTGSAKPGSLFPGYSALNHLAQQVSPLLGGGGGAIARVTSGGAAGFAGGGMAGFAGGGMAGMAAGAGIGLLGYGLYKGASAVNEGHDREKVLATDIDKFKRSLGGTSESFDKLRDQSRMIGDAFNLTYLESRNISTEFAKIARSNVGAIDQASEGVGMAQAVGADEAQGSGFMAHLRKDQSIGEKKSDARIMAIQFAEALRRTGSTLNAGDLMTAIQGFSGDTARRGLSAPNVEGYAGLLSAIVGGKIPGLDVNGAGSLIGRADSSFQGGGGAGQASSTLQYMAMGGDKIGLMGAQMREAAGMFASNDSVFGNADSPVNQYTGGSMLKHKGSSSGLEDVIGMIKANSGGNKELEIMTLARHLKLNPNEAATFLNMQGQGQLRGMMGLASQYEGVDLGKMSSAGYTTLAQIQAAEGDAGELGKVRDGLSVRSDLSKDQSEKLTAMKGMGGKDLQDALVKFSTTMEREKTEGDQIKSAAVRTANSTDLLAEKLIPASIMGNNLLAELVQQFPPNSPYLKEMEMQKFKDRVALSPDAIKSGKVAAGTVSDLNDDYNRDLRRPMVRGSGITGASRMAVLEKQYRQLGDKMVTPRDVADSFEKSEVDAMKKRVDAELKPAGVVGTGDVVSRKTAGGSLKLTDGMKEAYGFMRNKGWTHEQASGIVANLEAESGMALDPSIKEVGGGPGMGIAQWGKARQKDFREWSGSGGKNIWEVSREKQLEFMHFEMTEGKEKAAGDRLRGAKTAGDSGEIVSRHFERPFDKNGAAATRRRRADELAGTLVPATIPPNDPAKTAAAAADAQRLQVSLGEQRSTVTVNLVGAPGSGQLDQSVTSSGTSKAQPSGSISTDPRKYRA